MVTKDVNRPRDVDNVRPITLGLGVRFIVFYIGPREKPLRLAWSVDRRCSVLLAQLPAA
jgi:hypothetical protein